VYRLCRVNLEDREKINEQLRELARLLKSKHKAKKVYLYGSFARGNFHEASDIDLIIVGDFEGRMHQRIGKILDLTSLPVEPLVYTEAEFEQMKERPFLKEVLAAAKEL
jgi:predicted nucleotidyltransferase